MVFLVVVYYYEPVRYSTITAGLQFYLLRDNLLLEITTLIHSDQTFIISEDLRGLSLPFFVAFANFLSLLKIMLLLKNLKKI